MNEWVGEWVDGLVSEWESDWVSDKLVSLWEIYVQGIPFVLQGY